MRVDRKLNKEARVKYQAFKLGLNEIRDFDKQELLDLKCLKIKAASQQQTKTNQISTNVKMDEHIMYSDKTEVTEHPIDGLFQTHDDEEC